MIDSREVFPLDIPEQEFTIRIIGVTKELFVFTIVDRVGIKKDEKFNMLKKYIQNDSELRLFKHNLMQRVDNMLNVEYIS